MTSQFCVRPSFEIHSERQAELHSRGDVNILGSRYSAVVDPKLAAQLNDPETHEQRERACFGILQSFSSIASHEVRQGMKASLEEARLALSVDDGMATSVTVPAVYASIGYDPWDRGFILDELCKEIRVWGHEWIVARMDCPSPKFLIPLLTRIMSQRINMIASNVDRRDAAKRALENIAKTREFTTTNFDSNESTEKHRLNRTGRRLVSDWNEEANSDDEIDIEDDESDIDMLIEDAEMLDTDEQAIRETQASVDMTKFRGMKKKDVLKHSASSVTDMYRQLSIAIGKRLPKIVIVVGRGGGVSTSELIMDMAHISENLMEIGGLALRLVVGVEFSTAMFEASLSEDAHRVTLSQRINLVDPLRIKDALLTRLADLKDSVVDFPGGRTENSLSLPVPVNSSFLSHLHRIFVEDGMSLSLLARAVCIQILDVYNRPNSSPFIFLTNGVPYVAAVHSDHLQKLMIRCGISNQSIADVLPDKWSAALTTAISFVEENINNIADQIKQEATLACSHADLAPDHLLWTANRLEDLLKIPLPPNNNPNCIFHAQRANDSKLIEVLRSPFNPSSSDIPSLDLDSSVEGPSPLPPSRTHSGEQKVKSTLNYFSKDILPKAIIVSYLRRHLKAQAVKMTCSAFVVLEGKSVTSNNSFSLEHSCDAMNYVENFIDLLTVMTNIPPPSASQFIELLAVRLPNSPVNFLISFMHHAALLAIQNTLTIALLDIFDPMPAGKRFDTLKVLARLVATFRSPAEIRALPPQVSTGSLAPFEAEAVSTLSLTTSNSRASQLRSLRAGQSGANTSMANAAGPLNSAATVNSSDRSSTGAFIACRAVCRVFECMLRPGAFGCSPLVASLGIPILHPPKRGAMNRMGGQSLLRNIAAAPTERKIRDACDRRPPLANEARYLPVRKAMGIEGIAAIGQEQVSWMAESVPESRLVSLMQLSGGLNCKCCMVDPAEQPTSKSFGSLEDLVLVYRLVDLGGQNIDLLDCFQAFCALASRPPRFLTKKMRNESLRLVGRELEKLKFDSASLDAAERAGAASLNRDENSASLILSNYNTTEQEEPIIISNPLDGPTTRTLATIRGIAVEASNSLVKAEKLHSVLRDEKEVNASSAKGENLKVEQVIPIDIDLDNSSTSNNLDSKFSVETFKTTLETAEPKKRGRPVGSTTKHLSDVGLDIDNDDFSENPSQNPLSDDGACYLQQRGLKSMRMLRGSNIAALTESNNVATKRETNLIMALDKSLSTIPSHITKGVPGFSVVDETIRHGSLPLRFAVALTGLKRLGFIKPPANRASNNKAKLKALLLAETEREDAKENSDEDENQNRNEDYSDKTDNKVTISISSPPLKPNPSPKKGLIRRQSLIPEHQDLASPPRSKQSTSLSSVKENNSTCSTPTKKKQNILKSPSNQHLSEHQSDADLSPDGIVSRRRLGTAPFTPTRAPPPKKSDIGNGSNAPSRPASNAKKLPKSKATAKRRKKNEGEIDYRDVSDSSDVEHYSSSLTELSDDDSSCRISENCSSSDDDMSDADFPPKKDAAKALKMSRKQSTRPSSPKKRDPIVSSKRISSSSRGAKPSSEATIFTHNKEGGLSLQLKSAWAGLTVKKIDKIKGWVSNQKMLQEAMSDLQDIAISGSITADSTRKLINKNGNGTGQQKKKPDGSNFGVGEIEGAAGLFGAKLQNRISIGVKETN